MFRGLLVLALFLPFTVVAETFRCGNALIGEGMRTHQLIEACGKKWVPDEIRTGVQYLTSRKDIIRFVDELPPTANTYQWWIYRPYGQNERWLFVVNGRIESIEQR